MRSKSFSSLRGRCFKVSGLAVCALSCLLGSMIHGAETNTNSAPVQLTIPRSVFVDEAGTGKDPFFPSSMRRMKRVDTGKPAPVRDYSSLLKLTGIAGGARPIATINNRTFAVGEEQDVPVEGAKVKIRVLEIREKSVLISVEKLLVPMELKLRDVNLKFDE